MCLEKILDVSIGREKKLTDKELAEKVAETVFYFFGIAEEVEG